jgi:DNA-3-methyladenine glycosylase I
MSELKEIFTAVESSLIAEASLFMPKDRVLGYLNSHKGVNEKTFTDSELFDILVYIPFYSGFRAATVTSRMPIIREHFPDYETVSRYDSAKINEIASDPRMIQNRKKIEACVKNAQRFRRLVESHASFAAYIDSFSPKKSVDNLMRLRDDLIRRFDFVSKTTSYHLLCKIGMPVIKPDSAIRRIFFRLGLTESDDDDEYTLKSVVGTGERFAQATGHSHCYIDIVFAHYGQLATPELGMPQGICLEENPRCKCCLARQFCKFRCG